MFKVVRKLACLLATGHKRVMKERGEGGRGQLDAKYTHIVK
jgi:hypothetical protein